ncbi:MarR family winged helix-turn-helix transcriptional regulator [Liberiplasma polymorphum]|uniref:MarR family winged helix-turn-helix transcriptional regulator n=1 Tax=Liberiplasma polymorphum TaxID=3374570 RepID=UPI003776266D
MAANLKTITILFRAHNAIANVIKDDVAKYGLNTTEFGTLEALYHKGPLTVKEILEKVLIANSSMSYVIETLVKKGYIQKQCKKNDRRSFVVSLTKQGQKFMDEVYPIHETRLLDVLNRLTEEEKTQLQTLLKKIGKSTE